MEFAEECMRAMLWHDMGWGQLTYLDSEEYKANADKAIKAASEYNPVMMGL